MLNFLRWTLANITATIVAIMVGLPIAYNGYYFVDRWLDFFDCSGIPCDDRAFPTMILMGIIGGLIGGVVGYLAFQKLTRCGIVVKYLIRYAILGAFLWPVVGVFPIAFYLIVIYFDFDFGRLNSAFFSIFSSNRVSTQVYNYIWFFVIFVLVPGFALGIGLAVLRRIPKFNITRFWQHN